MKRVLLINPRLPDEYNFIIKTYKYPFLPPATGLAILASAVEDIARVTIVDESWERLNWMEYLSGFDLVGISDIFTVHDRAMAIARQLRRMFGRGVKIFVGGVNATNLGERILRNHPEIDYVISGDGEPALRALVEGKLSAQTPNIFYRSGGKIISTQHQWQDINKLPRWSLKHFSRSAQEAYDSRLAKKVVSRGRALPISLSRGCWKADQRGKCYYCSLYKRPPAFLDPHKAWEQIKFLHDEYGVDYFFETGDDLVAGGYVQKLAAAKPQGLNDVAIEAYAHPLDFTLEKVKALKKIGVKNITIGIEHVNRAIMHNVNKDYDTGQILSKLDLLRDQQVSFIPSFLFGFPGETWQTLKENLDFASLLVRRYGKLVGRQFFATLIPMVGSGLFQKVSNSAAAAKTYDAAGHNLWLDDQIDYGRLTSVHLRYFTKVSCVDIKTILKRAHELGDDREWAGFGGVENLPTFTDNL